MKLKKRQSKVAKVNFAVMYGGKIFQPIRLSGR